MRAFNIVVYVVFIISLIIYPYISNGWSFEKRIEIEIYIAAFAIIYRIQIFRDEIKKD